MDFISKFPILLPAIFAAIPAAIWFFVTIANSKTGKKTALGIFLLGVLTAPILLGIQVFWTKFPAFNIASFIEGTSLNDNGKYVLLFILFGIMEEVIKLYVIRIIDNKTFLIKSVNDAIKYSILSALGFSFAENIYYLYQFWDSLSIGQLGGLYIFRTIFTTAAHMIFSGTFGYYFGLGKFSIYIKETAELSGQKNRFSNFVEDIFKLAPSQAYKEVMIFKGLLIAVFMHATYNLILQFNLTVPIIIFVILGYSFIQYKLSRKTEHVVLNMDISNKKERTISKENSAIITELLAMWLQDKRYKDVEQIAKRLLERDPDNENAKLILAGAEDGLTSKDNLGSSILKFISDKNLSKDRSVLEKLEKIKQPQVKNLQQKINKLGEEGYYRLDI